MNQLSTRCAISGKILFLAMGLTFLGCHESPGDPDTDCCNVTDFVPAVEPGAETEVMVPMSDCVRLSTDVYLPPGGGPGPFPTILIRLPYDKEQGIEGVPLMKIAALVFGLNGFASVIQDTRGRFDSEGEWDPFIHEQADGIDTVHWIEAQPWFDGNLGLFGASYFGFTQLAVAHQRPACLKAMIPLITSSSIYSWLFHSGLPRADMAINWAFGMDDRYEFGSFPEDRFLEAALHWPLGEGDDATIGDKEWFDGWLDHPFDDGYYSRYLPEDAVEGIDIPTLMFTGWFDIFLDGQLADFATIQARETAPGNTRIILGPWTHEMGVDEAHDLDFVDGGSLVTFLGPMVDWFERHLKGKPVCGDWGPVTIYDPGLGVWHDRTTLWSTGGEPVSLYLSGGQGAALCLPSGGLGASPPAGAGRITYTYDPLDPVFNYGGPLLQFDAGCLLEPGHCLRPDVITFESAPFDRNTTLDGEIALDLLVSSSAPDTAFVGRLSLVKPDGKAYYLRQGVKTLSHRTGDRRPATYTPGQAVAIRIDMPPVLWTIRRGESLRLEVSSSSFPTVVQHPNVAADRFAVTAPEPAEQTLHIDPSRPARLVFRTAPSRE